MTGVPDDGGRETDADPVRVRVGRSEGAGPRVVRTGPAVELADCTPGDLPDVDARREDPNGASCDVAADTGEGDGDGGTPTPAGRPALNPETVLAAVRGTDPVGGVRVECPPPGPVHEYVGLVGREPTLNLRGALAAAARSRGHVAPNRETLRRARQTLREFETASDVTGAIDEAKRRVAEASEREATLRERVSTLRGRVVALREAYGDGPDAATGDDPEENDPNGDASGRGPTVPSGEGADRDHHRAESTGDERADATGREPAVDDDPVAAAEAAYRDAVRELSEVETERIAGEQRLARLREVARETRDERDRRLRLEDRVANLERRVRLSLAQSVYGEFAAAVDRLPGAGAAGDAPGEYEGPPATAALAVVRVADTAAPVVLAGRRFPDARTASERLRAPVVRL